MFWKSRKVTDYFGIGCNSEKHPTPATSDKVNTIPLLRESEASNTYRSFSLSRNKK